jgi:hypothetical protein
MTAVRITAVIAPAFSQSGKAVRWVDETASHNTFSMMLESTDLEAQLTEDDELTDDDTETLPPSIVENQSSLIDWALSSQKHGSQNDTRPDEAQTLSGRLLSQLDTISGALEHLPSMAHSSPNAHKRLIALRSQADPGAVEYQSGKSTKETNLAFVTIQLDLVEDNVHAGKTDPAMSLGSESASQLKDPIFHETAAHADSIPASEPALQVLSQISISVSQGTGQPLVLSTVQNFHHFDQHEALHSEQKLLRFMLQPESLGDVEVTLRQIGQDTKVTISVMAGAAAEAVSRDMVLLEDRLGLLLGSNMTGLVTVSIEIRDPELDQGQFMHPGIRQHPDGTELSSGRGFGREGRGHSHDQREPLRNSGNSPHEMDNSSELTMRYRRIV